MNIFPEGQFIDNQVGPVAVAETELKIEPIGKPDAAHDLRGCGAMDMYGNFSLQNLDEHVFSQISFGRDGIFLIFFLFFILLPALYIVLSIEKSFFCQVIDRHQRRRHLFFLAINTDRIAFDGHLQIYDILEDHLLWRCILQLYSHAYATDDISASRTGYDGCYSAGQSDFDGGIIKIEGVQRSDLWSNRIRHLVAVRVLLDERNAVNTQMAVNINQAR